MMFDLISLGESSRLRLLRSLKNDAHAPARASVNVTGDIRLEGRLIESAAGGFVIPANPASESGEHS